MTTQISQFTSSQINNSSDYIPFIRSTDNAGWDLNNYKVLACDFVVSCALIAVKSLTNAIHKDTGTGSTIRYNDNCVNDNCVFGDYGTIRGGSNNVIIDNYSTVGGGQYNSASGISSVIGGGCGNSSDGMCSVVMGGQSNDADGNSSVIGGGVCNVVDGTKSNILGGQCNFVAGNCSTIISGQCNLIERNYSVINSGIHNYISGSYSVIGGGGLNDLSGSCSGIFGGGYNSIREHNDVFILGSNITASANKSTYIDSLAITCQSLPTGVAGQLAFDGVNLRLFTGGTWTCICY